MSELWSLLHFIMPTLFDSHEEFTEWLAKGYRRTCEDGSCKAAAGVQGGCRTSRFGQVVDWMTTLLTSFSKCSSRLYVRRVKLDVQNELPEKTEYVVPMQLTPTQRAMYDEIERAAGGQVSRMLRLPGLDSANGSGDGDADGDADGDDEGNDAMKSSASGDEDDGSSMTSDAQPTTDPEYDGDHGDDEHTDSDTGDEAQVDDSAVDSSISRRTSVGADDSVLHQSVVGKYALRGKKLQNIVMQLPQSV